MKLNLDFEEIERYLSKNVYRKLEVDDWKL